MATANEFRQEYDVIDYLTTHPSGLTCKEATELLCVSRLPAVIHRLKKKGYKFRTDRITGLTRHGNPTWWAVYYYEGKEDAVA